MTPRTRASLGFAPKENPASSTVLWNEINCPPNMLLSVASSGSRRLISLSAQGGTPFAHSHSPKTATFVTLGTSVMFTVTGPSSPAWFRRSRAQPVESSPLAVLNAPMAMMRLIQCCMLKAEG